MPPHAIVIDCGFLNPCTMTLFCPLCMLLITAFRHFKSPATIALNRVYIQTMLFCGTCVSTIVSAVYFRTCMSTIRYSFGSE